MADGPHHVDRGMRDQIARYRTAFIAVVTMFVLAILVGGYILANERLSLPSWVPVVGKNTFTLNADFATGQALTPGQGQAVTIAGAKIGEIASVDAGGGQAHVSMDIEPRYARYIYRDATLLLRPKTQLKDMTVEVSPGKPSSGRIPNGYTVPLAQTAPDVNFDEFLASLDAETRTYLQELLAGAATGLKGNATKLAADFKRFDPIARYLRQISSQLQLRNRNIERSVHNFQLIVSALGEKDRELAQLISSSDSVFEVFASQNRNFQQTIQALPGALAKTRRGLGKLAKTAEVAGPALKALEPFAKNLAGAENASRPFFAKTAPIFEKQIRPLARRVNPTVQSLQPSLQQLGESFKPLSQSVAVFNELFNELAYNPGPKQGGFMFFADWGAHNLNSLLSSADAHGPLGRTVVYMNCELLGLLKGVSEVNATAHVLVSLLNPPSQQECQQLGLSTGAATTVTTAATKASASGGKGR